MKLDEARSLLKHPLLGVLDRRLGHLDPNTYRMQLDELADEILDCILDGAVISSAWLDGLVCVPWSWECPVLAIPLKGRETT